MNKTILNNIISAALSFDSEGFVNPQATVDNLLYALEVGVAREWDVDARINKAVNQVFDAHPGESFSERALHVALAIRAEGVGLTLRDLDSGFEDWVKRNVVNHKDATRSTRFVSKRGPGQGISRV